MTIQPSISTMIHSASQSNNSSNNLLANIFQKLRKIETKEGLFQISVEIIYQVLECDRVVVYSLQSDSYCKVIAEAVTSGYAQILGSIIKDACFESGYIEKYQKGRVRAVADIYKAGMSFCHIENLERIQVKANLVVPLIDRDASLLGLLVVHQCSQIRQWQQSEVDFLLQIADWTMEQIAEKEQYQNLSSQIEQLQLCQETLEEVTKEIHAAQDSNTVLQLATRRAKELLKCDRVVAYGLEDENIGKIVAESTLPSLAPILGRIIIDPCLEHSYREKYQDGRVRAINNIYEAGMTPCYIENLENIGVKANLVVPINLDNGKIFGLLVAHQCFQFREWQPEDVDCLEKIAFQAGLCLSKTKILEKLQLIKFDVSGLNDTKKKLEIVKLGIKEIQEPIKITSNSLIEINNLNKLLDREFNLISQNSSIQTKKDTKLIQIFVKKLILNINDYNIL
ncbi:Methyl-accepting chemotaxis sensory transducer [Hyella patelloides LEGE 07179]|uniref:Methyl-accepting chemotaxis sensory transducer n=1 Tax=Hyella patelloides LEGE 07179 TaxID=945734 RepID=A0A563VZC5_9CYAN|nr:GAF domain-containing protein [Hyella patelloides]VEP16613.1 Methyl-accepting chemotaxis sensory transducer [Hyella patelloides LEGE 07179]